MLHICKSTSINAKPHFVRILSRGPLFSILLVTYVTATTAYSANAFHPAGPHKILNISSFLGRLNRYRLYIYSLHWTSLDLRAFLNISSGAGAGRKLFLISNEFYIFSHGDPSDVLLVQRDL